MSRMTNTTVTKGVSTPALVPRLRFPEFREAGGWSKITLGQAATFYNGRAYKQEELLESGKYPVLRVGNFFTNKNWYYSDLELDETKYCDNGDLLYAWSASFGPRVWSGGKVIYHYHIWKVEEHRGVDRQFLFITLENETEKMKTQSANGLGLLHITKGTIEGWSFSFPPQPAEQQRIASCLSSLDALITAETQKLDTLRDYKKGLMQQLFPAEGETVPRLRFAEFRDAGEWEVGFIGDLAITVMGNAFRSTDFVERGTQVVRIGNLYQAELQLERAPVYLSDTQAEENSKFRIQPLDLLMSMTGTVGKRDYGFVIQVPPDCKPLLLNQRVMKLAPTIKCNLGFLLQLLKSDQLLDAIYSVPGGTKQANLSAQHIKDLEISYPPKSEQQRIATCLSSLDALITAETQKLEALKTHKKGLMQQLFPAMDSE